MKPLLIFLLSITTITSYCQVKTGSDGGMHPSGNYPVTLNKEVKGSSFFKQSLAQRDAIPVYMRDTGMIVCVGNDSSFYTWDGSAWAKFASITAAGGIVSGGGNTYTKDTTFTPDGSAYDFTIPTAALNAFSVQYIGYKPGDDLSPTFSGNSVSLHFNYPPSSLNPIHIKIIGY